MEGDPDEEPKGEDEEEKGEGEEEADEEDIDLEEEFVEDSDGEKGMLEEVEGDEGDDLEKMRGQLRYDRRNYASRLIAVWIFQVSFSILILREAFVDGNLEFKETPPLKIGFTRFIASMVMHVVVSEEIMNGLKMMKYSANHWWKFSNPRLAWLSGFLQMSAMFCVAIVNYFVITISDNVLDLAKDFTALMIIGEFDDYMSKASETYASNDEIALMCVEEDLFKDLLLIEVTTSRAAKHNACVKLGKDEILEDVNKNRKERNKEPIKRPPTIRLKFLQRPVYSMLEFFIYKIFRLLYVSIWFYFFPFIVLCAMYVWPVIKSDYKI